jgi:hypothetical protein
MQAQECPGNDKYGNLRSNQYENRNPRIARKGGKRRNQVDQVVNWCAARRGGST